MNQMKFSRREALRMGGAALCAAALVRPLQAADTKPKQILYFTKSSGFQHSVVKRPEGELAFSEKILTEIGKKHGFDVTCSKDGTIFDGAHEKYDAYVFYTSGDLTTVGAEDKAPAMSKAGKQALLDAVHSGKGFVGIHAATDSFRGGKEIDPYIKMVGGEFVSHGAQQKATMKVVDSKFPGMGGLGEEFELLEEWYTLKDFAPDMHVLLVTETKGMQGPMYQRPPFPGTWARKHGQGNVFYTSLGHREDVWTNPLFEQIILGALNWVTGIAKAEVPSNFAQVTPEANKMSY
jgi:type 1 glutamine amidotransferase